MNFRRLVRRERLEIGIAPSIRRQDQEQVHSRVSQDRPKPSSRALILCKVAIPNNRSRNRCSRQVFLEPEKCANPGRDDCQCDCGRCISAAGREAFPKTSRYRLSTPGRRTGEIEPGEPAAYRIYAEASDRPVRNPLLPLQSARRRRPQGNACIRSSSQSSSRKQTQYSCAGVLQGLVVGMARRVALHQYA